MRAQIRDKCTQICSDAPCLWSRKAVAFPNFRRAVRTIKDKHRFTIRCYHMDMGGSVIT